MSGSKRPAHVHALLAQHGDGGRDDRRFLAAHFAVFAGMWIEPGYRESRLKDAEVVAQRGVGHVCAGDDVFGAAASRSPA